MPTLSTFSFELNEVRLVSIALSPWWVASDICKILDISNVSQAIAKLDNDEKLAYTLHTSGQGRETLLINESGLYSLVLTSRKAQAKRFKKWLTSEVIPAIRKTGSYSAIANSQPQLPSITNAKLTQLTTEKEVIRTKIKELRQLLSKEESKLQAVSETLIEEAKAFKSANRELMQQSALCQQILDEAKDNNPFLSVGSTKR